MTWWELVLVAFGGLAYYYTGEYVAETARKRAMSPWKPWVFTFFVLFWPIPLSLVILWILIDKIIAVLWKGRHG